ncbi:MULTISPECIES: hypothetical protein [unclassified Phenylobacterium]|jgi:hypothetical protein|uniref:hypothetical protein n=1 Tax=unclassified Phenylobacterium TaxID=2640670 RepID=UPI00083A0FAD|nr:MULTISPECIES: hypothetical protein [unclassified Phenylobacterium]
MRTTTNLLATILAVAGLAACATQPGTPHWSGNPKFSVGLNAPTVVGVDAAARERAENAPK